MSEEEKNLREIVGEIGGMMPTSMIVENLRGYALEVDGPMAGGMAVAADRLEALDRFWRDRKKQLVEEGDFTKRRLNHEDAEYLRSLAVAGSMVVRSRWLRNFADMVEATIADEESG